MSKNKLRPTGWLYVLAIFLPIFACGITAVPVYRSIPKLPGAFGNLSINSLTQVIVPGSAEINFKKTGAYAVYYEYRSTIDGMSYMRSQYPPKMKCQLISKETGQRIELASPDAKVEMYSTGNQERVGY